MQGVDGAQNATQATSHADMRRAAATRLAAECRRADDGGRAAVGVASAADSAAVLAAAAAYVARVRLSEEGTGEQAGGGGRDVGRPQASVARCC